MNTVKSRASSGASFGIGPNARLQSAPSTRISAGADPERSNAMGGPSFEMTLSMAPFFFTRRAAATSRIDVGSSWRRTETCRIDTECLFFHIDAEAHEIPVRAARHLSEPPHALLDVLHLGRKEV